MGDVKPPVPVKLFTGVLAADAEILQAVQQVLEKRLGNIDFASERFSFSLTDYYASEMGSPLFRWFWSFHELIDPAELPEIKRFTNDVEQVFCLEGKRRVNLDPGYLDFHKVVLASVKERGQKIYLGLGIYADPTLYYLKGRFHPYDWSLPDFKIDTYYHVFKHIRELYRLALR